MNWFVFLDLLVPFGVTFGGLVWYDQKLRRARRNRAREAQSDSPIN
jgi:hypothetical protein